MPLAMCVCNEGKEWRVGKCCGKCMGGNRPMRIIISRIKSESRQKLGKGYCSLMNNLALYIAGR